MSFGPGRTCGPTAQSLQWGEILAIHSTRIEAELLRRQPDNNRPERPEIVSAADPLVMSSIGFTVPLAAIYRTTALAVGA